MGRYINPEKTKIVYCKDEWIVLKIFLIEDLEKY